MATYKSALEEAKLQFTKLKKGASTAIASAAGGRYGDIRQKADTLFDNVGIPRKTIQNVPSWSELKTRTSNFLASPVPRVAIDNPLTPGSIRSEYQSGRRQIPTVRDYLNIDPAISFGKKLTEPLTRAPGAYGKLDPGSLYGQVTQANKNGLNSPQSIELLAQVTADMFTPLSASTRTIKKAAEPSLEAVTRGAVKRIQDIR